MAGESLGGSISVPLRGKGHYRIARRFVPAGTTLAGILWTLRNPNNSGMLVVVERANLRLVQLAAPTAAIEDQFNLTFARSYTVADTTGSVSIAPAAGQQKLRTNMGDATAEVRESNVAAGASGGTKTIDTDFMLVGGVFVSAAVAATGGFPAAEIFDYNPPVGNGEYPIVLDANEGILIRNANALGAASGIILYFELEWSEIAAYPGV